MNSILRNALVIVGTVIAAYFIFGLVRHGGHTAANVAGEAQKKF